MNKPLRNTPKQARESTFIIRCLRLLPNRIVMVLTGVLLIGGFVAYKNHQATRHNDALASVIEEKRQLIAANEHGAAATEPETATEPAETLAATSAPETEMPADQPDNADTNPSPSAPENKSAKKPGCAKELSVAKRLRDAALAAEEAYHQSQLSEIKKLPLIGRLTDTILNETGRHLAKIHDIEQAYLSALESADCGY